MSMTLKIGTGQTGTAPPRARSGSPRLNAGRLAPTEVPVRIRINDFSRVANAADYDRSDAKAAGVKAAAAGPAVHVKGLVSGWRSMGSTWLIATFSIGATLVAAVLLLRGGQDVSPNASPPILSAPGWRQADESSMPRTASAKSKSGRSRSARSRSITRSMNRSAERQGTPSTVDQQVGEPRFGEQRLGETPPPPALPTWSVGPSSPQNVIPNNADAEAQGPSLPGPPNSSAQSTGRPLRDSIQARMAALPRSAAINQPARLSPSSGGIAAVEVNTATALPSQQQASRASDGEPVEPGTARIERIESLPASPAPGSQP